MENTLQVKVTRMKIKQENGMKALCSIVIGGMIAINDIRIVENKERKLFVAMPSRKMPDGTFKDIANPVNATARKIIEDVVLKEYEKMSQLDENVLKLIS
ncbi:SpoVG family protein [Cytobacillus oceanisediminis]|uniref:SpoVG family protein n=1 Tax=Cytobacillus oceanisediminis TaxID=665099 RepID=UPI001FB2FFD2|nr:SpoVG family protein [Cytobacillus oceanisediminis]UOE58120.1 SpoVG family protein [Cytobacillus oceanisediminis]